MMVAGCPALPLGEVRVVSGRLEVSGRQFAMVDLGDPFVARPAYRTWVLRALAVTCTVVVVGGAVIVFDHAVVTRVVLVAVLVVALAAAAVAMTATPNSY